MYFFICHRPAPLNAYVTDNHYHTSYLTRQYGISNILRGTRWRKPPITFNITSVTTQLSHPYRNTVCTTTLYIIYRDQTVAPVFVSNFATTTHCRCDFLRFTYRAAQSLFLNATIRTKYRKATVYYSGSRLTRIVNLLT